MLLMARSESGSSCPLEEGQTGTGMCLQFTEYLCTDIVCAVRGGWWWRAMAWNTPRAASSVSRRSSRQAVGIYCMIRQHLVSNAPRPRSVWVHSLK